MLKKKTIMQIRKILMITAAAMILLYGLNRILLYRSFDKSVPEITFEQNMLQVSVEVTEEELLEGVKATDKKDGDVTETVIIESISKMLEDNVRVVTYAAFDKDNNVGKAERKIQYTDYKAPRFSLEAPLGSSSLTVNAGDMLEPLKAMDCVDGDISDQIVITSMDIGGLSAEDASLICEVQVTNSSGDIASLKLPINVSMSGNSGNKMIELKEYLIYTKVGKNVNLKSYIKEDTGDVKVESDLDTSTPGVYTATYTQTIGQTKAQTQLYIVVEE